MCKDAVLKIGFCNFTSYIMCKFYGILPPHFVLIPSVLQFVLQYATFVECEKWFVILKSSIIFISVVCTFTIYRDHLTEMITNWQVLHLMIGSSNLGYFIYFTSTLVAACKKWFCWSNVCGFILMAYPKILFLAAFLLLLSFWVDLCHQANDDEEDDEDDSMQQALLENSKNKPNSSNKDGHRICCSFQSIHVGSHQKFVIAV
ncbi:unnamed protein product [Prunus armeniaca]